MPVVSGVTVVTNARVFYHHARLRALPGARHSLRPLIWRAGTRQQNLRGDAARWRAVSIEGNCLSGNDWPETSILPRREVYSSFRGGAQHRARNLEIPGLVLWTIPE